MSIFARIKLSRKAAKDHKGKAAEKENKGNALVEYKHVPTHAAIDALAGCPPSWRIEEDRLKIKEQHKRRSEMISGGISLPTFSNMNGNAGPSSKASHLRRSNSYHGSYSNYNPTCFDRNSESWAHEQMHRRYKAGRVSLHDSGVPSPLVQSEEVSPAASSDNSIISEKPSETLEPKQNPRRLSQRPQVNVYPDKQIFEHLHIGTTRKLGEAPLSLPPVTVKGSMAAVNAMSQEDKAKGSRWYSRGKQNSATLVI
ncbi:hypothetical protein B7494_g4519 [Chlorociboria aeruginascens]|nr:hypothetical protein B7494_g4519 [Chlorociboria aeruginascens]